MPAFPIKIFRVAERSMEPAIRQGSYVIVNSWYGKLEAGNVVVLRSPEDNRILLKRVKSLNSGKISVEGDNKEQSRDSRHFGEVDIKRVLGKVLFVL